MAVARVRIHSAENFEGQPIDVVGLSRSVEINKGPWEKYFEQQGQTVRRLPRGLSVLGGVSTEYFMVHPPAQSREELRAFGRACIGRSEGDEQQEPLVDYGNDIVVMDNRLHDPSHYDPADVLATA